MKQIIGELLVLGETIPVKDSTLIENNLWDLGIPDGHGSDDFLSARIDAIGLFHFTIHMSCGELVNLYEVMVERTVFSGSNHRRSVPARDQ